MRLAPYPQRRGRRSRIGTRWCHGEDGCSERSGRVGRARLHAQDAAVEVDAHRRCAVGGDLDRLACAGETQPRLDLIGPGLELLEQRRRAGVAHQRPVGAGPGDAPVHGTVERRTARPEPGREIEPWRRAGRLFGGGFACRGLGRRRARRALQIGESDRLAECRSKSGSVLRVPQLAAGLLRDAADLLQLRLVEAEGDGVDDKVRAAAENLADGRADVLATVVEVVGDQHDACRRGAGDGVGGFAQGEGDRRLALRVQLFDRNGHSLWSAHVGWNDHLGVAAVAAAAVPERGKADARVGAQAGQQAAQQLAHHLQLRSLVGAEVAPHGARAVDDDHRRRRCLLGARCGPAAAQRDSGGVMMRPFAKGAACGSLSCSVRRGRSLGFGAEHSRSVAAAVSGRAATIAAA